MYSTYSTFNPSDELLPRHQCLNMPILNQPSYKLSNKLRPLFNIPISVPALNPIATVLSSTSPKRILLPKHNRDLRPPLCISYPPRRNLSIPPRQPHLRIYIYKLPWP